MTFEKFLNMDTPFYNIIYAIKIGINFLLILFIMDFMYKVGSYEYINVLGGFVVLTMTAFSDILSFLGGLSGYLLIKYALTTINNEIINKDMQNRFLNGDYVDGDFVEKMIKESIINRGYVLKDEIN